ncbi:MAG TPA: hypothetical protein VK996_08120 [Ramlibacter sp.]|nr:hypothetical protein [Ramlibacter sp.]
MSDTPHTSQVYSAERCLIATPLASLAANGASPAQVAQAAIAVWAAVHEALAPVIGQGGVTALYKRSLHLSRESHPWLTSVYEGSAVPGDFSALRAALSEQDSAVAAAAHDAMLQTMCDLLTRLIGSSLTARLLQGVGPSPSTGSAGQDDSP